MRSFQPATGDGHGTRHLLRILTFLNWSAFGIGALMALLYAVVCLMMWPYPELVARNGGGFGQILSITVALTLFAWLAGLAAWSLHAGHRLRWVAQGALALALTGLIVFVALTR